jgi:hypothetical protein
MNARLGKPRLVSSLTKVLKSITVFMPFRRCSFMTQQDYPLEEYPQYEMIVGGKTELFALPQAAKIVRNNPECPVFGNLVFDSEDAVPRLMTEEDREAIRRAADGHRYDENG